MFRSIALATLLLLTPAFAEDLKPGPGLDALTKACATCHSLDYIRMNSTFLTPAAWKAEIAKMRTSFAAGYDDATAAAVADYLAANYAVASKP